MSDEPNPYAESPNDDFVEASREKGATRARSSSLIPVLVQYVTFLGIVGILLFVVPEKILWFEKTDQYLSPLQAFIVTASLRVTRYWYVFVPFCTILFLGELGFLQLVRNIRPVWWMVAIPSSIPLALYVIGLIIFMIMS